jgi:hypothetical protein
MSEIKFIEKPIDDSIWDMDPDDLVKYIRELYGEEYVMEQPPLPSEITKILCK